LTAISPAISQKERRVKTLQNLFEDGLRDILYAEKKILDALARMADAATAEQAGNAFRLHREQTEGQVARLEQVFEMIGQKPGGKKCPAIDGILEEGDEIAREYADSPSLDAGLIAAAQAVEHYEMARYGTLATWAAQLGLVDAAALLDETLQEEKLTDDLLTELAEEIANPEAAEAEG
jgi:ferritin-like metal-binding protein YciE